MSQAKSDGPCSSTRSQGKAESTGKKSGQRSQEKSEKTPDFKQMIADALAPIRNDLAKIPSKETVDVMLDDLLSRIEEKLTQRFRKESVSSSHMSMHSSKRWSHWKAQWWS